MLQKTYVFFKEHPVLFLSMISTYVMSLSFFSAYNLMQNYGVNLSTFIAVEDLLLLAFRNFYLLGFLVLNIIVFLVYWVIYVYRSSEVASATTQLVVDVEASNNSTPLEQREKFVERAEANNNKINKIEKDYKNHKNFAVVIYIVASFGAANMAANFEFTDIQQGKNGSVKVFLKGNFPSFKNGHEYKKILVTSKYIFLESIGDKNQFPVLVIPQSNINYLLAGPTEKAP